MGCAALVRLRQAWHPVKANPTANCSQPRQVAREQQNQAGKGDQTHQFDKCCLCCADLMQGIDGFSWKAAKREKSQREPAYGPADGLYEEVIPKPPKDPENPQKQRLGNVEKI
jgi:hypothetical protein